MAEPKAHKKEETGADGEAKRRLWQPLFDPGPKPCFAEYAFHEKMQQLNVSEFSIRRVTPMFFPAVKYVVKRRVNRTKQETLGSILLESTAWCRVRSRPGFLAGHLVLPST